MVTPELVDSSYASIEKRFLAFVLDAIILCIPCTIGNYSMPFLGGIVVLFFYAPILESSVLQATLGKYLVGIQVVDLAGQRLSLRVASIRNFLKFFSSALLFAGFFFAFFTEKKQALHDLLADTMVVYGKSERPVVDVWISSVKQVFRFNFSDNSALIISQLERLQVLRDRGVLTEEEFQDQKRKILAKEL